jgi:hypothetical protein
MFDGEHSVRNSGIRVKSGTRDLVCFEALLLQDRESNCSERVQLISATCSFQALTIDTRVYGLADVDSRRFRRYETDEPCPVL